MNNLPDLIPNPDPLPVAPGWLSFFSYFTYFLHLLAVGIMFGISLFAVLGYIKGKSEKKWQMLAFRMSKILPFFIAFAVNLGVAPLLFLQVLYGNFFYTASILMGIPWLLLIVFLIAAYYSAYRITFKKKTGGRHEVLLSLFITLTFSWVAFMLVNSNTLLLVPARWQIYFSNMSGLNLNLGEVTLFPRFILYIFLFIGIGGIFTAILYKIKNKAEEAVLGLHFAATAAGYFCFLAVPAFLYYLLFLPPKIKPVFLNPGTPWFWLALLFAAFLLLASFFNFKKKVILSASIYTTGLIIFVFIRNHIRHLYLKPYSGKISALSTNSQYWVMALFFLVLLLGLSLVTYLTIKTFREYKEHDTLS